MKSFADWTDEIRSLMNPPKAKCDGNHGGACCADPECWSRAELWSGMDLASGKDTCNMSTVKFTPTGRIMWPTRRMSVEEFTKAYEQEAPDLKMTAAERGEAIHKAVTEMLRHMDYSKLEERVMAAGVGTRLHHALERAVKRNTGRRCGKSWSRNEFYRPMVELAGNRPTLIICDEFE